MQILWAMSANRTTPVHEASIQSGVSLQRLGRELRLARIAAGMTQLQVAKRLGWSQARISLIERGRYVSATLQDLFRHAAVVGLRFWAQLFPGGRRLLDAPQLALLERLHRRVSRNCGWELEVPVPIEGDLRAGDCRITAAGRTILVEAITRFADAQAQTRAAQRKRRDLGSDYLVLLIADSGSNRRALREAGPAFRAAFPITPRAALRALASASDLGGDAIILL